MMFLLRITTELLWNVYHKLQDCMKLRKKISYHCAQIRFSRAYSKKSREREMDTRRQLELKNGLLLIWMLIQSVVPLPLPKSNQKNRFLWMPIEWWTPKAIWLAHYLTSVTWISWKGKENLNFRLEQLIILQIPWIANPLQLSKIPWENLI